MNHPILLSIQVGRPAQHGAEGAPNPLDRPWTSSFVKAPIAGPVLLRATNLDGDEQADPVNHGGPDKAVCCYPAAHYDAWRPELDLPIPPAAAAFGENFTIAGLTEAEVCIGDSYRVGGAVVQVSQPRQPCWKLARRHRLKDLPLRVQETGRTGWYFRVLAEGPVAAGDPLVLFDRPRPAWTIDRANRVMHRDKHDRALAAELASLPELSASWRRTLLKRAEGAAGADTAPRVSGPNNQ